MANNGKRRNRDEGEEPGRVARLRNRVMDLIHFLSYDIWRLNPEAMSNQKNSLFNGIKTVMLTVRNVQELNIAASARSLTYRTLLSIVPLLAVIFAIARGFGIENIVESSIFNLLLGGTPETEMTYTAPATSIDTLSIFTDEISSTEPELAGQQRIEYGITFSEELSAEGRTREFLNLLFGMIDNSLEEAKGGGIFAGVGILLLIYTILLLFNE